MDRKDLLKLLNLTEKPKEVEEVEYDDPELEDVDDLSDTALVLDDWDMDRGHECYKNNTELRILKGVDSEAMADFHGVCFLPDVKFVDFCTSNRRMEFLKAMMENGDHLALRKETNLNRFTSEVAAIKIAHQYAKLVKEDVERRNCRGGRATTEDDRNEDLLALLKAAGEAAKEAQEEVEEVQEACDGLGIGGEARNGTVDPKKVAELFHRVKSNNLIKRAMNLAGRYRMAARAKQQTKMLHGYDDIVGIAMKDEIGQLLTEEQMMLVDPDFELDTMRRLMEKETLGNDYRSTEKLGKGPIVIILDESGSMTMNDRIANGKAFALSMAYIARWQKRWICLVGYSDAGCGNYLAMPPDKWNEDKLLDWIGHFYQGGTDPDEPFIDLPKKWDLLGCPKGKTDMILFTDGLMRVNHVKDSYLAWKQKEKVKLITMILGTRFAGDLQSVSDEVFFLDDNIALGKEGIERCFAL